MRAPTIGWIRVSPALRKQLIQSGDKFKNPKLTYRFTRYAWRVEIRLCGYDTLAVWWDLREMPKTASAAIRREATEAIALLMQTVGSLDDMKPVWKRVLRASSDPEMLRREIVRNREFVDYISARNREEDGGK